MERIKKDWCESAQKVGRVCLGVRTVTRHDCEAAAFEPGMQSLRGEDSKFGGWAIDVKICTSPGRYGGAVSLRYLTGRRRISVQGWLNLSYPAALCLPTAPPWRLVRERHLQSPNEPSWEVVSAASTKDVSPSKPDARLSRRPSK